MLKTRIAVLVSGGGTNLGALIDAQKNGILNSGEICLVCSNRADAFALTRAENNGIKTVVIERRNTTQEDFENKLIAVLKKNGIELIILAGFMCILSKRFTDEFAERIINVHPSLIPSFCGEGFYGLKVHEAVLKAGVKVTGATVHIVNEIPDGGKILMQKAVEIKEGDTPETLQKRVMKEAEWIILPLAAEEMSKKLLGERKMSIYYIYDIGELIKDNSYVGRGIVTGKSKNGRFAVSAYFIMGRSENSRNRIFIENKDEVKILPYDESKVKDPSLIIYYPVRKLTDDLIVTNGDQTDTIYSYISQGKTFEEALQTREFEPDAPNFTPRISSIIYNESSPDFTYKLNILKSGDEKGSVCSRYTFSYTPIDGIGHFIHTYNCDGNPIPTFTGEPERVEIPDDIDLFTDKLWNNLNNANKISLYVRYYDTESKSAETRMINKNNGGCNE